MRHSAHQQLTACSSGKLTYSTKRIAKTAATRRSRQAKKQRVLPRPALRGSTVSTLLIDSERLTPEQLQALAPMLREAMRDPLWQLSPLGEDVVAYLPVKSRRLTRSSMEDCEASLVKLARFFCDLRIEDFEPPVGTERVEEFLDHHWGTLARRTYNKNLSYVREFFKHFRLRGRLTGDPCLLIERAKPPQVHRETFSVDERNAIVASAADRRDRICLCLLLDYGIRQGALRAIRFKHFDHSRRRLTIFTKSQKVRELPLPHAALWTDLERLILDTQAQPEHFLLPRRLGAHGTLRPELPMGSHGVHSWWYRRLADAGIVSPGTSSGEKMHKARHTAGQRLLDATGNLKAVQALLGHSTISTTADVYTDWTADQLAASLLQMTEREES